MDIFRQSIDFKMPIGGILSQQGNMGFDEDDEAENNEDAEDDDDDVYTDNSMTLEVAVMKEKADKALM